MCKECPWWPEVKTIGVDYYAEGEYAIIAILKDGSVEQLGASDDAQSAIIAAMNIGSENDFEIVFSDGIRELAYDFLINNGILKDDQP